ncbi:unnamed protein product [Kuraishia capsulata CBS 1993]|uniref:Zn(2)-C6 fungal-type domain-containing protein n=1 Tax=Kuraishia capsulata CBS 1993 TaxID=1382522 RepID=W6MY02_9ASCO|nr:uncharacterized protein KUCA_T00005773001 [Kuraishia capsulata CBS 1993]CDK29780.1 unnamed protein product [Kuraishia capsulata CBS 1993]
MDITNSYSEGPSQKKRKHALIRASVACVQCRKAKAKCVHLPSKRSCVRCDRMKLSCSLASLQIGVLDSVDLGIAASPERDDEMLVTLTRKVDDLHRGMAHLLGQSMNAATFPAQPPINAISAAPAIVPDGMAMGNKKPQAIDLDTTFFNTTPFRDVREVSSFYSLPFSRELVYDIRPDFERERLSFQYDLVNMGIVSLKLAKDLVTVCNEMYGKWTSFPQDVKPKQLLESIRKDSSLLLAVCCLLGLRHYDGVVKRIGLDMQILGVISQILSLSLQNLPQSKQFLQSMVLLSAYSLSCSKGSIYFDGWFLSGYALLHYITREMNLNFLSEKFKSHPERMNHFRLWNHLALIHLSHCILSGRPCLIDELRLDQCREILDLTLARNFDARVVAKLSILLTLYNCLQFHESLEDSMAELDSTWNDWEYLCEQQPLGQFIELTYRFARLMLLRREFMVKFSKSEDFMIHRSRSQDIESPLAHADPVFGAATLGALLNEILEESIAMLTIACNSNYGEFLKSADMVKFMTVYSALILINTIRQGFNSNDWLSSSALSNAKTSIDDCIRLCETVQRDLKVGEEFIKGHILLMVKFGESIHEQEI